MRGSLNPPTPETSSTQAQVDGLQMNTNLATQEPDMNPSDDLIDVVGSVDSVGADRNQDDDDDDDDDIISDRLLTSLTDAAISNLSQLAALQERCESQQQQQQQQHQHSQSHSHQQQYHHQQQHPLHPLNIRQSHHRASSPLAEVSPSLNALVDCDPGVDQFGGHNPFSSPSMAVDQAVAVAALAMRNAMNLPTSSSNLITQGKRTLSSSSSISPQSTIQTDLGSSQSLASAVAAAAAAAAAAANDHQHHHLLQQQQQQQHQHQHQHQHHQQQHSRMSQHSNRLISPSANFYHSLEQQHAQNLHQHSHSPASSLHFSPSTSMSPSPSSLSASHSRRSASAATPFSLMSPIPSPSYPRRHYITDRMPLLSPSPTSGLVTCSSSTSGASTSLAHYLHQSHQQRSASALAGNPISSPTASPMSSTGSSAVSPLMSNKNSSQARLNNMQIRHKFGYLGSGRAQFNSPHGFCLGLNQEIVVADTNNHRVCIFDKSGTYLTQFGSPGKEEGQLWNPRKVAILHRPPIDFSSGSSSKSPSLLGPQLQLCQSQRDKSFSNQFGGGSNNNSSTSIADSGQQLMNFGTGASSRVVGSNSNNTSEPLYVVCDRGAERSRMQLFTKDGAFIKKIGIQYIDIVAGLAITQNGLIIVVDSVSPTVYMINGETGVLNGWFDCSGHMKEPSDIAVKSDAPGNEYFICDFKGHCVVVFSEQGEYLRKIGHDGLTSYPNGIDISDDGDILVGDSHGNRFHVVVFDRNGNFVSQFECPHVKVSRCCGLKITREGYIVTLAKNNHHVLVLDTIHI